VDFYFVNTYLQSKLRLTTMYVHVYVSAPLFLCGDLCNIPSFGLHRTRHIYIYYIYIYIYHIRTCIHTYARTHVSLFLCGAPLLRKHAVCINLLLTWSCAPSYRCTAQSYTSCIILHLVHHLTPTAPSYTSCIILHLLHHLTPRESSYTSCIILHLVHHLTPRASPYT
jgi:hypothetical protein